MKKYLRVFIFLAIVALLFFGLKAYYTNKSYKVSENLPDLALCNMNGESIYLSEYQGKKLFITVWATWCKGCREMKPMIDNSKLQLKSVDSLVFIDISLDRTLDDWKEYVEQNPSLGVQFISDEDSKKILRSFGSRGIPFCVAVDAKGKFVTSLGGISSVLDVRNIIESAD